MKKLFLFLGFLFFLVNMYSQNEIWVDDGTVYYAQKIEIDSLGYITIEDDKGKTKYFDTLDIFAVIRQNDTVFYYANNPDYPLERAKMFVKGEIDGKNYRNNYVYAGAFITGLATPIALISANFSAFASPIFSVVYVASFSSVNTDSKFCNIPDNLKDNEDYIKGYKLSASKKKIMNNSIFSVVGLTTGIVTLIILEK